MGPPHEVTLFDSCQFGPLQLEVIEGHLALNTTVGEARVVLKPVDAGDFAVMAFTLLVSWALDRVEVVHVGVGAHSGGEHVTTIAEADLSAALHRDAVVLRDGARQHVHHEELVTDGGQDVEATWVEGDSRSVFANRGLPRHLKLPLTIVPNEDVVFLTGDDELLAQASVHASDLLMVERPVNVLTAG